MCVCMWSTPSRKFSVQITQKSQLWKKLCQKSLKTVNRIPSHTIPYHTIPYHTIPYYKAYHTIPYHTIPYHTIAYHTNQPATKNYPLWRVELVQCVKNINKRLVLISYILITHVHLVCVSRISDNICYEAHTKSQAWREFEPWKNM